jgi:hypothetical protein
MLYEKKIKKKVSYIVKIYYFCKLNKEITKQIKFKVI